MHFHLFVVSSDEPKTKQKNMIVKCFTAYFYGKP